MPDDRPEVHLRVLTPEDAPWMTQLDDQGYEGMARRFAWNEEKLAAEIASGIWACEEQVGWAVLVDGEPVGFAFARNLTGGEGVLDIRLSEAVRGQGVGREALRQLADHHFADHPDLLRLEGRTHEHNVPMQRAFTAAGFLMEARYRDSFEQPDGTLASEWGYAITHSDWKAGRHRADDNGYNLHGLSFSLDNLPDEGAHMPKGSLTKFLQEGRRVLAKYGGGKVSDGEAAGIIHGDTIRYRFIHRYQEHEIITGLGHGRLQRRGDGRLELIDEFERDKDGARGLHVWVERR
ncbi:MAG: GNAT family N-acetyltransferase [Actinomycetota bacterium]|nr:GNAT family N-acetyltransferase [Actinomycetota bacterium]